jgi:hypothetical protein
MLAAQSGREGRGSGWHVSHGVGMEGVLLNAFSQTKSYAKRLRCLLDTAGSLASATTGGLLTTIGSRWIRCRRTRISAKSTACSGA